MCDHCASTDGARRAQNCALYTSVCFVVSVPLFAMCSRLFMSVCRSQMFVNMRCRIHSLYTPVGDSRLLSAVTDFHDKNSKFFCTLRLFPQIDIQPPKYRFPCVISGHTIFEVSAQNQTPTSLNASAKKTRMKRFVPMLLASFCPLLASGAALLTTHF